MKHRRLSLAVLALTPLLAIGACDVIEKITGKAGETGGRTELSSVPLDARAVSGGVRPASEMAALLAVEPVMVAPGEIVVGAKVEEQLDDSARAMGLASNLVNRLRLGGMSALSELPADVLVQVQLRAEQSASVIAERAANQVVQRLGVAGEVEIQPGGVVKIDLTSNDRASPTTFNRFAQEATATPEATAEPAAIPWTGEACPRVVNAQTLSADIELATRCAVSRLQSSGQFEYVDPNYIVTVEMDRLPSWAGGPKQQPANTPAQQPGQTTTPTTQPAPAQPPAQAPATTASALPNDPLEPLQWHYRARGTGAGQSPGGAGFEAFWVRANQTGSRQIRVAVIDTGLDTRHPEIANSPNVAAGIDLINNVERAGDNDGVDTDAYDVGDRCGAQPESSYHGTHVAGTIGAGRTNDRVGVAGGAWQVTVIPVRVLGRCGGELADISSGIRWAAGIAPAVLPDGRQYPNPTPADIINMSLSVGVACPASMQAAIDAAVARGAVVVVAAGNKAAPARNYAPANCNNVVVVGAGDEQGNLSFYSNFGPEVDILAPGGDTFADRDGDGRPDGVLSTRSTTTGCYDPAGNGGAAGGQTCFYSFLQGTSMAAPHVSAALALLASQTGLRGRDLETALFTRAISPIDPAQCRIECARNANATPIAGDTTMCMRGCGRGMLDLARAADMASAAPAGGSTATPRRR
ncbi:MAG: S8 family serine peptidase [Hyphomonadaceae bacterium]|nr:S8 family serine peptidase [Hyphomonadaceae bacterium]